MGRPQETAAAGSWSQDSGLCAGAAEGHSAAAGARWGDGTPQWWEPDRDLESSVVGQLKPQAGGTASGQRGPGDEAQPARPECVAGVRPRPWRTPARSGSVPSCSHLQPEFRVNRRSHSYKRGKAEREGGWQRSAQTACSETREAPGPGGGAGGEHPDGLQSPGRPSRKPGRQGAAHGKDGDRPRGARTPERHAGAGSARRRSETGSDSGDGPLGPRHAGEGEARGAVGGGRWTRSAPRARRRPRRDPHFSRRCPFSSWTVLWLKPWTT